MDSSCYFALGTSTSILPKLSFQNVDKRFWGEKINNNGFFKRFASDSGSNKFGNWKFNYSVVYAVATSKNPKEAMVCLSVYSLLLKWHYACFVSIRFIGTLRNGLKNCLIDSFHVLQKYRGLKSAAALVFCRQ